MSEVSLSVEGVRKSYGEGHLRIDALLPTTLSLRPGELAMITGPSGSGKSTLLAILSGLLTPDEGVVMALGQHLESLSPNQRDRFRLANAGFIFQGFHLLPAMTASQQVEIVLRQQGVGPAEARSRAAAALDAVGLSRRLRNLPGEMSGGEKQRVAIARALAKRPTLIFADEPTSALDSENGRQVAKLLREEAHASGATVVCVTHDPRLADLADRVLRMEDGRLS
ncbi:MULTISPECIES: ABC transporter ATP-binding protein [Caulobacter]|jgi:putative ABC transport system ATP-binding protein|uniref:ABC-type antimicrobial peptide transport system, ATPase component n=1 Tax=Caulobacter vibrioides OR37 TaxID=1292034 RepID=R0D618_CAUVI|nr:MULTISPECIES: ABC transporter ATP-binding protein [Caulobacter]ENZ83800.1 ABC-type antimicrobial peptide transport system, ATPase component [Caulobacter vibrioides OR37]MBQ1563482.1 ABC transporter ATP-binding protein [Caulobacter sp.]